MLTITNEIKPTGPHVVIGKDGKRTLYLGDVKMQMAERDEPKPKTEKDESK